VDDVEGEFLAEIALVLLRVGGGGVGGHADLAGDAELGLALKGDHVGRGRVVEEIVVEFGEFRVGHEREREFAVGAAAEEFLAVFVEDGDDAGDGFFVEAQARVGVVDVERAGHGNQAVGTASAPCSWG